MSEITETETLQLIASKPCAEISAGRWREILRGERVELPVVDYCKDFRQLCGPCEARKFLADKGIPYELLPDKNDEY